MGADYFNNRKKIIEFVKLFFAGSFCLHISDILPNFVIYNIIGNVLFMNICVMFILNLNKTHLFFENLINFRHLFDERVKNNFIRFFAEV